MLCDFDIVPSSTTMNSPIWKMVFVALVGSILDYSLSPPQPPPAPKELLKPPESFTTRFPRTSASSGQVSFIAKPIYIVSCAPPAQQLVSNRW
ncbi:hypothetical protein M404DRAFT_610506 [Pisolithus tinctorius Marx 270]|uniref:Uncharacterized protein n=1 Tax=Pisolithus tinctorius Marx 270 TaxID=870435 RepID=A0A0C3NAR7_PISTI|nr:hypothetical protein M404DRAFT_610506 [Pisolithus tinctorius Marx 270]